MELTGTIRRRLFVLQHAQDTSGWPEGGIAYHDRVKAHLGGAIDEHLRFWWLEHAEHIPGSVIPMRTHPAPTTRLIDYAGAHEAALDAMVAWVERGITPPSSTGYTFEITDKALRLPATAADRGGIQPVGQATANGSDRADIRAGKNVRLEVSAEAPVGAIVEVAWDFDGSGSWPEVRHPPEPVKSIQDSVQHVFDQPGTYFPSIRVVTHHTGDSDDRHGRVMNLARCRVVVQ